MPAILIVDDEPIERNGIKSLIKRFQYDLTIVEAENGEQALEIVNRGEIDILFTDIKMPFMNGLELAEQARKCHPELEIVIYSAYGEFDYARKAIEVKAVNYLLKPMVLDQFNRTMTDIIALLRSREAERERHEKMLEDYRIGTLHAKEKQLLDWLGGSLREQQADRRSPLPDESYADKSFLLVLADYKRKFFDASYTEFTSMLGAMASGAFDCVNLNEYQSVILFRYDARGPAPDPEEFARQLLQQLRERFREQVVIVHSGIIDDAGQIAAEYNRLEQTLDYKFFVEGSAVLSAPNEAAGLAGKGNQAQTILDTLYKQIELGDYDGTERMLPMLWSHLENNNGLSVLYCKYLISEIVKKLHAQANSAEPFSPMIETVFGCRDLQQLKELIAREIGKLRSKQEGGERSEETNRVIRSVMDIIDSEYMHDISLESIAEKVYLTPSYLSYLIKKQTGRSLIKQLTLVRLEKAKQLLKQTNMKIVDIAQAVGYSNSSYFCITFKNYSGTTPAKYRENGAG
ncbi:response regulator transcription factor [Paenibacillus arenilitoris]|uniref:Response regulator n=1 Tax=Paenibacillus arenilitoris TaxID=2772299 RepID=A0A927CUK8_9BACL|nr:response regulator [Paenibacillus arenilitoris]MBD2871840.1 response regulator [Paenibacillus arenilitoris]